MIVNSHRQDAFGAFLTDDIFIEDFLDFLGLGKLVAGALGALFQFFSDYVVAQLHAFVADEYAGAGDEFPNLVLALSTKRAIQNLAIIMLAARIFAHAVLKLAEPPAFERRQRSYKYRLYSTRPTGRKDTTPRVVIEFRTSRPEAKSGVT
jgi:hypothetical protein